MTNAPDKFTVCSPVWQVSTQSGAEDAAFNAELYDGTSKSPLVMSAGDTVQIHFHLGAPGQGWNITVTDLTTGHSGTIVLNSKYGPLLPLFSTQQIGNSDESAIVAVLVNTQTVLCLRDNSSRNFDFLPSRVQVVISAADF